MNNPKSSSYTEQAYPWYNLRSSSPYTILISHASCFHIQPILHRILHIVLSLSGLS